VPPPFATITIKDDQKSDPPIAIRKVRVPLAPASFTLMLIRRPFTGRSREDASRRRLPACHALNYLKTVLCVSSAGV
jgi:hypothetical protein